MVHQASVAETWGNSMAQGCQPSARTNGFPPSFWLRRGSKALKNLRGCWGCHQKAGSMDSIAEKSQVTSRFCYAKQWMYLRSISNWCGQETNTNHRDLFQTLTNREEKSQKHVQKSVSDEGTYQKTHKKSATLNLNWPFHVGTYFSKPWNVGGFETSSLRGYPLVK